jgi:hypothetical protein
MATTETRREPHTHDLKCWPASYRAIVSGRKRFEFRKDDRTPAFRSGDVVCLHEFDPTAAISGDGDVRGFTGKKLVMFIGFVERSATMPDGWCGFEIVTPEDFNRASLVVRGDS